ncbi:MAG: BrnT family toxin [Bryobacteraceae bacterium]
MSNITFAWDPRKARNDLAKHGVSFEEAQSVFLDGKAVLIDDPDHSDEERRFVIPGYTSHARCLIVSHCYLEDDSVIRLISARKATTREEKDYWRKQ